MYKFLVLPTSNRTLETISMNTPSFFHGMTLQCFVLSFYIGATAICNLFLYQWGLKIVSLPHIGFLITKNETFKTLDPAEFTPSVAYAENPFNNRLVGIIVSCAAIPITWVASYLGLYFYFKDESCLIQFSPKKQVFLIENAAL